MEDDYHIECSIDNEQNFWDELDAIVSASCNTYELIDDALRAWLQLVSSNRDQYLQCEDDVASCSQKLLSSHIFRENKDYVRTQIIYSLLQEDEYGPLHVIANFLLVDGRSDETTFRRMVHEGCFSRLLELVKGCRDDDRRLHRLLLELIYEMSRIERLRPDDLLQVDDAFVIYLFQIIEALSDDASDPYHYPVIRVLLVLNEQYMIASTAAAVDPTSPTVPMTNRVIKVLSLQGPMFRTFGENIILLLNRETEASVQLLILKLLYLLFTTKSTYEYFYTNDLRVLLDVIIRNLLDLPNELMSLRHTYLRVLSPLLSHTQLSQPPHYKRDEILRVLKVLSGSGNAHFAPADETTLRLVDRVASVPWLCEPNSADEDEIVEKFLGISLSQSHSASSSSVVDVAAVSERPGVKTPRRRTEFPVEVKDGALDESAANAPPKAERNGEKGLARPSRPKKALPEVPKHRHGVPMAPQEATVLINGNLPKKTPPKAPPPRRRTKHKPSTTKSCSECAPETPHPIA
ncbi:hypothetical protein VTK73DRAFT_4373 [Phialemonium thermophilum]|uniref:SPIN90/Ldb17 leucine-rich domain-containing protein n=1 Tax=Phialemonium thermophilum TaxID=223376 RepID=A0ABR3Y0G2_9PEZI